MAERRGYQAVNTSAAQADMDLDNMSQAHLPPSAAAGDGRAGSVNRGGSPSSSSGCCRRRDRSGLISAISNLSIQYNFQSLIVALVLMKDHVGEDKAAYPCTSDQESLLKSLVFAGAITGQLLMGYAGDAWGRRNAMLLTNALTFVGALGSAIFPWGTDPGVIYNVIMVCRFLLGVGVGGKYPLAATMVSEEDESGGGKKKHSSTEVAKGFFWQTPGAMIPYVVGIIVLCGYGEDKVGAAYRDIVSTQFRIILGLGALPAFVVMVLTYLQPGESQAFREAKEQQEAMQQAQAGGGGGRRLSNNPLAVALRHPEYWRGLLGTGFCWLLYDFIYYGMTAYQPTIIRQVFGQNETVVANYAQNIAVTAMGLPGVIVAIALLQWLGSKRLQSWGFVMIAALSLPFAAVLWNKTADDQASGSGLWVEFSLLCALIFALNWGVNVSTYVLPTEVFPSEIRSSFFGVSAAMAKLGALIGSSTFDQIGIHSAGRYGMTYVVCAIFGVIGILITHFFVPPNRAKTFTGCGTPRCTRTGPVDSSALDDQGDYDYDRGSADDGGFAGGLSRGSSNAAYSPLGGTKALDDVSSSATDSPDNRYMDVRHQSPGRIS